MELLRQLQKKNKISPPSFLPANTHYLAIGGSESYGVATDFSDKDIYGFAIPPKDYIFPHLRGEIPGFGTRGPNFEEWEEHHVQDGDVGYDFKVYSIIKFFNLTMSGNPNMIDILFVPRRCILHSTAIGELVRENRHLFLAKHSWPRFKGYAYEQMRKLKKFSPKGKRAALIKEHGYDVKHGYHIVRLLNEIEQILVKHDLDLECNREQLKAIRAGKWSYERLVEYFNDKEKELESIKNNSSLRDKPDEQAIKNLLLRCLEMHYGDLASAVVDENRSTQLLREVYDKLDKEKAAFLA